MITIELMVMIVGSGIIICLGITHAQYKIIDVALIDIMKREEF